jgi:hypothetical protein
MMNNFKFSLVDKGPLAAVATEGMYRRVRSTYGPLSALIISVFASLFVLISKLFPADVGYLLFKKKKNKK